MSIVPKINKLLAKLDKKNRKCNFMLQNVSKKYKIARICKFLSIPSIPNFPSILNFPSIPSILTIQSNPNFLSILNFPSIPSFLSFLSFLSLPNFPNFQYSILSQSMSKCPPSFVGCLLLLSVLSDGRVQ